MKKVLAFVLSVAMLCSVTACSSKGNSGNGDKTAMTAGTYTGTAKGMNDDVTVEVEVTADSIVSVKVTSEQETPGIGSSLKDADGNVLTAGGAAPVDSIPEAIVANQSLAVDNAAGATITSAAVKAAVKDALTQAGANPDDWNAEVPAGEAVADQEADVAVVGGGGAGLAAAIAAGQQGAKVVVIEKNAEVGGDTLVCGAIYNTPDEELQKEVTMTDAVKTTVENALATEITSEDGKALQAEVQKQWDEYKKSGRTDLFDTKEWYALQTWLGGDQVANLDLVKVLCYDAYDGLQWIEDLGMSFSDKIGQGAGALWQRTHTSTMQMGTGFLSTYVKNVDKDENVTVLTSCTGKELVTDESGAVTGVVCEDKAGNKFTVTAKSVILATGGFAANSRMVQEYNTSGKWDDLSKVATTNRFSCSQGDGITMAKAVGAGLTDMEQIQLLYLGNTQDGQLTKYPPRDD